MKLETPRIGQHVFQASLYKHGQDTDHGPGDLWTTRKEADIDGEEMAAAYDPEWQKRNPDAIEASVREYVIDSVDEDGSWGGCTVD